MTFDKHNMKIWNKNILINSQLTEDNINFLTTQGLPIKSFGIIEIFSEYESNGGVILGYDFDTPIICVNSNVFAFEENLTRFVNSNIEKFYSSLLEFQNYIHFITDIKEEDKALKIIDVIMQKLSNIDKKSLDDENNYWSIIIEQMKNGNL